MFDSKPIVTVVVTLMVLTGAFIVYDWFIGPVTEFDKLAAALAKPMVGPDDEPVPKSGRDADHAAIRALGAQCDEQNANVKWDMNRFGFRSQSNRGLGQFLYANAYTIMADNPKKLRVYPITVIQIEPAKSNIPSEDEITSIRAHEAVLEFNKPITLFEVPKAEDLVSAYISGDVELKTNRKTSNPDDDITVMTQRLDYSVEKNLIWSEEFIRVRSNQATIEGVGLEIEKLPPQVAGAPVVKRKVAVRSVKIPREVRFFLEIDDNNEGSLFGGQGKKPVVTDKTKKKQPIPLTVYSKGPFKFNLEDNIATFEKQVRVLRKVPPKKPGDKEGFDQLECDELALKFEPKPADPKVAAVKEEQNPKRLSSKMEGESNLQIVSIEAKGKEVILVSESEKLQATGNYLFHDAKARKAILRGEHEVVASSEMKPNQNAVIHAKKLVIDQSDAKDIRTFRADGPEGWLEIREEQPDKTTKTPMRAYWQGYLDLKSVPNQDTKIVTLFDNVELQDEERGALRSNKLKIMLEPVEEFQTSVQEPKRANKLEPVLIEAEDNVSVRSDQLAVNTERLTMTIVRAKPIPVDPVGPAIQRETKTRRGEREPVAQSNNKKSKNGELKVRKDDSKKEDPLDVKAARVVVVLERSGSVTRPLKAFAEGDVHVTQTPKTPGERPPEMTGHSLELSRTPNGDILNVQGSDQKWALIKTADFQMSAPRLITMDEVQNNVKVDGPGYIIRESQNDLTGKKSTKSQLLRVDWKRSMSFDGKLALFDGNTVARQENAEIVCNSMNVVFDQRIDFKQMRQNREERQKGQKPNIDKVDCEGDVKATDRERDPESEDFIRLSTLTATEVHYYNIDGRCIAKGMGEVMIVERAVQREGDAQSLAKVRKFPFQLTRARFNDQMSGDKNNKWVKFRGPVNIYHSPAERMDQKVNEEQLIENAIMIDAEGMTEMFISERNGNKYRDFKAQENVRVRGKEFSADCTQLTYDQEKDLIVFNGTTNLPVVFYRQVRPGEPWQRTSSEVVKHFRQTGQVSIQGADGIDFNMPAKPDKAAKKK